MTLIVSAAGSYHWNERRWEQRWQRYALFASSLSIQCFGFFFLHTKSRYANHRWKNFSVSEQRSLLCLHYFIFCLDLYDNEDEINEHQPFPSLLQVIGLIYLLHRSYGRDFFNVSSIATYFLAVSVLKLKQRSSYLYIHRYSKLFLNMWVSTLSSNGFLRWKWVWNIVYYVPICLINIILFLICWFSSQDGSWDSNLSTYFNMNTYLDIILSCVLQQAGKRRIVFSCFDPDICTMWVPVHAYVDVCNESISNNSIATQHEHYVTELGIRFVSLKVLNNTLIFVLPCFPQGASQAEQISHPLPDPGNFWNVSRADGHPLPDHSNRHKFCPEWEYSGELCCIEVKNLSI